jgi:hypothetical protein
VRGGWVVRQLWFYWASAYALGGGVATGCDLDATKLLSAAHQSSELVRWAIVGGVHAKLKSLCLQAMDIKEPWFSVSALSPQVHFISCTQSQHCYL